MKILVIGVDFKMYASLVRILKNHDLIAFGVPDKKVKSNTFPELSSQEIQLILKKLKGVEPEQMFEKDSPNPSIFAKNCRKLRTRGRTR